MDQGSISEWRSGTSQEKSPCFLLCEAHPKRRIGFADLVAVHVSAKRIPFLRGYAELSVKYVTYGVVLRSLKPLVFLSFLGCLGSESNELWFRK